jgi:hypothetical protein
VRLSCLLIRRDLSRYVDAELNCRRAARVERHLASCDACQRQLDRLVEITRLVAGQPAPDPPQDAWHRLQAALASGRTGGSGDAAGRHRADRLSRARPLAWAAVLVVVVGLVTALPGLYDRLGPAPVLAHDVDIATFSAAIIDRSLDLASDFARVYQARAVSFEEARRSCPARKGPATELPAGFSLTRSLLFETDCCPGLAAEYRRGENWIAVVQVPSHHAFDWGGLDHEERQVGMSWCEVHEEYDVCSLVHHGANVNLLLLGDAEPQLLGEVAAFLAARTETPGGPPVPPAP